MTHEEDSIYVMVIRAPVESKQVYIGGIGQVQRTMRDGRIVVRFPKGVYKYSGALFWPKHLKEIDIKEHPEALI